MRSSRYRNSDQRPHHTPAGTEPLIKLDAGRRLDTLYVGTAPFPS